MRAKREDGVLANRKSEMKGAWKGYFEHSLGECRGSWISNCVEYGYGSKWKVAVCAGRE